MKRPKLNKLHPIRPAPHPYPCNTLITSLHSRKHSHLSTNSQILNHGLIQIRMGMEQLVSF